MCGTQIDRATRMVRAYKHPNRYEIIGRLLRHGKLSSGEIASYLKLEEHYISEQLDILCRNGLVTVEGFGEQRYFAANEARLQVLKKCVAVFNNSASN